MATNREIAELKKLLESFKPAHVKATRRGNELRRKYPPHKMPPECAAEIQILEAELEEALGSEQAEKLDAAYSNLSWALTEKQEELELKDELFTVYELLIGEGKTVWQICGALEVSQPTVCRRLKALQEKGLIEELPPVGPRYVVA